MAEENPLDLTSLLNLIRGIQAAQAASSTVAPEPQPDLPTGYSSEQAQRWIVWRNAKIQAAQVPQNVKDKMIASEDVGEDEPMPKPQSQAALDAWEAEQRARAGRRPGTPSTTGAPPQPGRDLPLEFGLQPDNSWGFSKTQPPEPRPNVQQIQYLLQQLSPQKPDERQNPEDMFTPEQNLSRNQAYAKPGPYLTALPPEQEAQFQAWVKANNVNWKPGDQDYDMRGFWLAQQQGDPLAKPAVDPNDKQVHYPDVFKTPYAATFSNESRYALPVAPQWKGDQYVLPNGHVQYDDVTGQWFEQPGMPRQAPQTERIQQLLQQLVPNLSAMPSNSGQNSTVPDWLPHGPLHWLEQTFPTPFDNNNWGTFQRWMQQNNKGMSPVESPGKSEPYWKDPSAPWNESDKPDPNTA